MGTAATVQETGQAATVAAGAVLVAVALLMPWAMRVQRQPPRGATGAMGATAATRGQVEVETALRAEVAALEIHLPPELRHDGKTFLGDTYSWYPCLAELRGVIDDIEAGAVALRGGAPEE